MEVVRWELLASSQHDVGSFRRLYPTTATGPKGDKAAKLAPDARCTTDQSELLASSLVSVWTLWDFVL